MPRADLSEPQVGTPRKRYDFLTVPASRARRAHPPGTFRARRRRPRRRLDFPLYPTWR